MVSFCKGVTAIHMHFQTLAEVKKEFSENQRKKNTNKCSIHVGH